MADFQVKITTPAQFEGAKALAEQLEKDIYKAQLLGKEFADLEEQQKRVQGAIAGASEEAKKGVDGLELSHRDLKESMRAVSQAAGGLGEVGLLLSGPTAVVFVLVTAFEKLQEAIKEATEDAVESARAMREFDATKVEAVADAARNMATAMQQYLTAQSDAAHGIAAMVAAARQQSNQRLAEINAEIDATKQLNAARQKLADAEVDRMVEMGSISREEGERRKHMNEEQNSAANASLEAQKRQAAIAEEKRELDEAKKRLPTEQSELQASSDRANSSAEQDRLQHQEDEAKKKAEEARKKSDATAGTAQVDQEHPIWAVAKEMATFGNRNWGQIMADEKRAAEAQAKYADLLESRAKFLAEQIEEEKRHREEAKKKADELQAQIIADQKTAATLPSKIASDQRIAATLAAAAAAANQAGAQTHATQEGAAHDQQVNRATGLDQARQQLDSARIGVEAHTESSRHLDAMIEEFMMMARHFHGRLATAEAKYEQYAQEARELRSMVISGR